MTLHAPATHAHRLSAWARRALHGGWVLACLNSLTTGAAAQVPSEPLQPLRYVVPTNQGMPLLALKGSRPVDGLLKDLAETMAARLGRPLEYVTLPSKRAMSALMRGEADVHCYVQPGWLEGNLLWTVRFITSAEVVAATKNAPPVASKAALADEPLGTVLGYRYPQIEQPLQNRFARRDTVDADTNLRRLALGRVRYALTDRLTLQHYIKRHPEAGLREVLEFDRSELGCAVSPREAAALEPINQALRQLRADGRLDQILDRYR